MAVSLVACSSGGDSKTADTASKKLVVYSPNSEGLIEATIPAFKEKYGIDVELVQAGTGELFKRIESEKENPQADIIFGGAYSTYNQHPDLFENYTSKNNDLVIDEYKNDGGFVTSYVLDGSVILVNKELIGDIKVTSYADLLNPALKGKISSGDPAASSSAFAHLTNMLLAKGGYDSDTAWAYVKDLFTNIDGKISSSSGSIYKGVSEGEMVIGLSYEDPCANLVKNGANVEVIYPEEGTVFLPAGSAIIKGASNMDNAKLFIDFITSKEIQDAYGTTTTNRPVLIDVKVGDYMKPMANIKTINEDREYVKNHKEDLVAKYKDIFTSIGG